ncbi:MAG: hypothetical protein M1825_005882 [Sarcosagium campestre]|nr:MAG: hypothetical protein M1825_005882 [Sarcosagium campestre]
MSRFQYEDALSLSSPDPLADSPKFVPTAPNTNRKGAARRSLAPISYPSLATPIPKSTLASRMLQTKEFIINTPPPRGRRTQSRSPVKGGAVQGDGAQSPWKIKVTVEAQPNDENGDGGYSYPPQTFSAELDSSPSKAAGSMRGRRGSARQGTRTTTMTVPLKGLESSSPQSPTKKRGRPRKSGTSPVKRPPTPARRRNSIGNAIEDDVTMSGAISAFPQKRGRGRPRKQSISLESQDDQRESDPSRASGEPENLADIHHLLESTPGATPKAKKPRGRRKAISPAQIAKDLGEDLFDHRPQSTSAPSEGFQNVNLDRAASRTESADVAGLVPSEEDAELIDDFDIVDTIPDDDGFLQVETQPEFQSSEAPAQMKMMDGTVNPGDDKTIDTHKENIRGDIYRQYPSPVSPPEDADFDHHETENLPSKPEMADSMPVRSDDTIEAAGFSIPSISSLPSSDDQPDRISSDQIDAAMQSRPSGNADADDTRVTFSAASTPQRAGVSTTQTLNRLEEMSMISDFSTSKFLAPAVAAAPPPVSSPVGIRSRRTSSRIPSTLDDIPETGESSALASMQSSPPPAFLKSQAAQRVRPSLEQQQTPAMPFSSPSLPPLVAAQAKPAENTRQASSTSASTKSSAEENGDKSPKLARAMRAGSVLQGALGAMSRLSSPFTSPAKIRKSSSPEKGARSGENLFEGFSAGTRRELRAGLRLGEELARRQHDTAEMEHSKLLVTQSAANAEDDVFGIDPGHYDAKSRSVVASVQLQSSPTKSNKSPGIISRLDDGDEDEDGYDDDEDNDDAMSWKADTPVKVVAAAGLRSSSTFAEMKSSHQPAAQMSAPSSVNASSKVNTTPAEQRWAQQRNAVSRKIAAAPASDVVIIDDSSPSDHSIIQDDNDAAPAPAVAGPSSSFSSEIDALPIGSSPIKPPTKLISPPRQGSSTSRGIMINDASISFQDYLEESAAAPLVQTAPVQLAPVQDRLSDLFPSSGIVKPPRSKIPSPWRRDQQIVYSDEITPDDSGLLTSRSGNPATTDPKTTATAAAAERRRAVPAVVATNSAPQKPEPERERGLLDLSALLGLKSLSPTKNWFRSSPATKSSPAATATAAVAPIAFESPSAVAAPSPPPLADSVAPSSVLSSGAGHGTASVPTSSVDRRRRQSSAALQTQTPSAQQSTPSPLMVSPPKSHLHSSYSSSSSSSSSSLLPQPLSSPSPATRISANHADVAAVPSTETLQPTFEPDSDSDPKVNDVVDPEQSIQLAIASDSDADADPESQAEAQAEEEAAEEEEEEAKITVDPDPTRDITTSPTNRKWRKSHWLVLDDLLRATPPQLLTPLIAHGRARATTPRIDPLPPAACQLPNLYRAVVTTNRGYNMLVGFAECAIVYEFQRRLRAAHSKSHSHSRHYSQVRNEEEGWEGWDERVLARRLAALRVGDYFRREREREKERSRAGGLFA